MVSSNTFGDVEVNFNKDLFVLFIGYWGQTMTYYVPQQTLAGAVSATPLLAGPPMPPPPAPSISTNGNPSLTGAVNIATGPQHTSAGPSSTTSSITSHTANNNNCNGINSAQNTGNMAGSYSCHVSGVNNNASYFTTNRLKRLTPPLFAPGNQNGGHQVMSAAAAAAAAAAAGVGATTYQLGHPVPALTIAAATPTQVAGASPHTELGGNHLGATTMYAIPPHPTLFPTNVFSAGGAPAAAAQPATIMPPTNHLHHSLATAMANGSNSGNGPTVPQPGCLHPNATGPLLTPFYTTHHTPYPGVPAVVHTARHAAIPFVDPNTLANFAQNPGNASFTFRMMGGGSGGSGGGNGSNSSQSASSTPQSLPSANLQPVQRNPPPVFSTPPAGGNYNNNNANNLNNNGSTPHYYGSLDQSIAANGAPIGCTNNNNNPQNSYNVITQNNSYEKRHNGGGGGGGNGCGKKYMSYNNNNNCNNNNGSSNNSNNSSHSNSNSGSNNSFSLRPNCMNANNNASIYNGNGKTPLLSTNLSDIRGSPNGNGVRPHSSKRGGGGNGAGGNADKQQQQQQHQQAQQSVQPLLNGPASYSNNTSSIPNAAVNNVTGYKMNSPADNNNTQSKPMRLNIGAANFRQKNYNNTNSSGNGGGGAVTTNTNAGSGGNTSGGNGMDYRRNPTPQRNSPATNSSGTEMSSNNSPISVQTSSNAGTPIAGVAPAVGCYGTSSYMVNTNNTANGNGNGNNGSMNHGNANGNGNSGGDGSAAAAAAAAAASSLYIAAARGPTHLPPHHLQAAGGNNGLIGTPGAPTAVAHQATTAMLGGAAAAAAAADAANAVVAAAAAASVTHQPLLGTYNPNTSSVYIKYGHTYIAHVS